MRLSRFGHGSVALQVTIRMIADMAILNFALLIGLLVDRVCFVGTLHTGVGVILSFLPQLAAMSVLSLVVFTLSGFYTRGRAYRSRYKALVVFQAVALSFLLFAFLQYASGGLLVVPRPVLIISGVLAEVSLVGARIWSAVWKSILKEEGQHSQEDAAGRPVQNVLVIGGAGYIGSALIPKLLVHGYRVRLLDAFMFGDDPIRGVANHRNLEVVRGDFRDIDALLRSMRGMDAVIHLGGIVGDPACALDEEFTIDVNVVATRLIAECAKGCRISRFIFASTCSVYGASDEVLDEQSALRPVSLYARSKIASERVLSRLTEKRFRPTILRFGTVYGFSGRVRFDLVVNLLTAKAVADNRITVVGADQWRPFVHVDDVAYAVTLALEAPLDQVGGETFNVGSNEQNRTLGEIGELIKRQVPTAELIISGCDADRRNYRVKFLKIRERLGFQPRWTLEAGIQQVIQAFTEGKVIDYHDPLYSNVKFLTDELAQGLAKADWASLRSLLSEPAAGMSGAEVK